MYVTLKSIINSSEFKSVNVIAGLNGLHRKVKNVSTIDLCAENTSIDCVQEGDLFISSLHQFLNDRDSSFNKLLEILIMRKCSGLIIVSKDNYNLITEKIIERCNDCNFPLLYFEENVRYSDIINFVNHYITINTMNASKEYRIQKILNEKLNEHEIIDILYSLKTSLDKYIVVICFSGSPRSEILHEDFQVEIINSTRDVYVDCKYIKYLILSEKTKEKLQIHIDAMKVKLNDFFTLSCRGYSRFYEKHEFKRALTEAVNAFRIANSSGILDFAFSPISSYRLLAMINDSCEAREFYNYFMEKLNENGSKEQTIDIMKTLKAYVCNKGNYSATAESINQHENTVRYRINKLRRWLELEDNVIEFNEIISLIVKLNIMNEEK